ncbi:MAG TPA: hypothetical protein D7I11_01085, partial [Candidatus Poseidoniales archaeon]
MTTDWISVPLVGLPLIASITMLAFVASASPAARHRIGPSVRMFTLLLSLGMLVVTTAMFFGFNQFAGEFDWVTMEFSKFNHEVRYVWIESLGIHWTVGMDALSFPMVWLTTFLLPVTIVATWNEKNAAVYFPLILMMGGALIGVFVALDLFMFYVFWELTLIPMFFLILKWGGHDRKYASQKFFIYTFTA